MKKHKKTFKERWEKFKDDLLVLFSIVMFGAVVAVVLIMESDGSAGSNFFTTTIAWTKRGIRWLFM